MLLFAATMFSDIYKYRCLLKCLIEKAFKLSRT
jgi:hypothetical protein